MCVFFGGVIGETLLSTASWNPENSLGLMSSGPSPMMPCSSCAKSFLWANERPKLRERSLIPTSGPVFFPTKAHTRSASTFAWNTDTPRHASQRGRTTHNIKLQNDMNLDILRNYLLTEFLQVWGNAVAQAVLHAFSQQVRRSHHPQCFPQGLKEAKRTLHTSGEWVCVYVRACGAHRDVVWWHGLQVALKSLTPFGSGLEFVHSNQVI